MYQTCWKHWIEKMKAPSIQYRLRKSPPLVTDVGDKFCWFKIWIYSLPYNIDGSRSYKSAGNVNHETYIKTEFYLTRLVSNSKTREPGWWMTYSKEHKRRSRRRRISRVFFLHRRCVCLEGDSGNQALRARAPARISTRLDTTSASQASHPLAQLFLFYYTRSARRWQTSDFPLW